MRVLITGSEGYLGSMLVDRLIKNDNIEVVIGVDACFFGENVNNEGKYMLIKERVDNISRGWAYWLNELKPDVVVSLAAISNDPACELNPALTRIINHFSVVQLAYECMLRGIRFIFASSAAIYGVINYEAREWSHASPISLYASEKLATERDLFDMASDKWLPKVFRMGTLFGCSKRPRFDLAIPAMLKSAYLDGKIFIYGGNQWRPFLSIDVASYAYECAIFDDDLDYVENLVLFNARISDIGHSIVEYFKTKYNKDIEVVQIQQSIDQRDYRMANAILSDPFGLSKDVIFAYYDDMIEQIFEIVDYNDSKYYTVRRYKELSI